MYNIYEVNTHNEKTKIAERSYYGNVENFLVGQFSDFALERVAVREYREGLEFWTICTNGRNGHKTHYYLVEKN